MSEGSRDPEGVAALGPWIPGDGPPPKRKPEPSKAPPRDPNPPQVPDVW